MMRNSIESFLYGICAVGVCAAVLSVCSGVKAICRRILKRGRKI